MIDYSFIYHPTDNAAALKINRDVLFSILSGIWDVMSHYDRDVRRDYIAHIVALTYPDMEFSAVCELTEKVLIKTEVIFGEISEILESFGINEGTYEAHLERLIGSSMIVKVQPSCLDEEI